MKTLWPDGYNTWTGRAAAMGWIWEKCYNPPLLKQRFAVFTAVVQGLDTLGCESWADLERKFEVSRSTITSMRRTLRVHFGLID